MHFSKEFSVKFSRLSAVSVMAVAMSCALTACSSGDDASTGKSASATSQAGSQAAKIAMPTPEDLNAVLNLAADPNAPIEQRTQTVQNGESASDLFPVMTKLRDESHAQFQVVNPILPGYSPNSVLAKVNLVLPDKEPQAADNVEFVYENGKWKLAQSWACTLIECQIRLRRCVRRIRGRRHRPQHRPPRHRLRVMLRPRQLRLVGTIIMRRLRQRPQPQPPPRHPPRIITPPLRQRPQLPSPRRITSKIRPRTRRWLGIIITTMRGS